MGWFDKRGTKVRPDELKIIQLIDREGGDSDPAGMVPIQPYSLGEGCNQYGIVPESGRRGILIVRTWP